MRLFCKPEVQTDVTSMLLGGFSPYLHRVFFDFASNAIEFELLDRIEHPSAIRVLRFERIRKLEIVPHEADHTDVNFIDSIIGVSREGGDFHFHTDRFSISFSCDPFREYNRNA